MHHTVTAVASGTVALVIGGRGSPAQPSESMFLLQLNREPSSPAMWSKVQLHSESSYMEPRWRHTATYMQLDNGQYLLTSVYNFTRLLSQICSRGGTALAIVIPHYTMPCR